MATTERPIPWANVWCERCSKWVVGDGKHICEYEGNLQGIERLLEHIKENEQWRTNLNKRVRLSRRR